MAKITDPSKAFHLKIKTLYDIEKQLEKALPKMAEAASNPDLAEGFETHLKETEEHSARLEKIFEMIGAAPERHASEGIKGIIADGEAIIATEAPEALKDAMLAGAARSAEHFEISCYTSAVEEAKALDLDEAADLLAETLDEEEATDEKLADAFEVSLEAAGEEAEADAEAEEEK